MTMNDHNDVNKTLEIEFEVGHISTILPGGSTAHNPPRTHEWRVFLRAADVNGDLNCLIQRCVFHLHADFPNNKRELKSTPFAIQESGYAGFHLPIEIYFKTKKEPKKFSIGYDLDLHRNVPGRPYQHKESYLQKYRYTFHNPEPNLRRKILAAGGKIVDSGPVVVNHDGNTELSGLSESTVRPSSQKKRPISPVPSASATSHKKAKVESLINETKKKAAQLAIKNENSSKPMVPIKKMPTPSSNKSPAISEQKLTKNVPSKDSKLVPKTSQETRQTAIPSKARLSTTLIKTQSATDIKLSIQSTTIEKKKTDSTSSPAKVKATNSSQTIAKIPINKKTVQVPVKTQPTSTPIIKSPVCISLHRDSSPASSIHSLPSTSTTGIQPAINQCKKIPKKIVPPAVVAEKSSRASICSSSLYRNSDRNYSSKPSSLSTKTPRDSSSINNSNSSLIISRTEETPANNKDRFQSRSHLPTQSISSGHDRKSDRPVSSVKKSFSQRLTSKLSPSYSPLKSNNVDVPSHDSAVAASSSIILSQSPANMTESSTTSSPATDLVHNETLVEVETHTNESDRIQPSDDSNSADEHASSSQQILSHQLSSSERTDIPHESDFSIDDDEDDLPTGLTNDELRSKLIYIYNRFQSNSMEDLTTFVRFFKRHHLIDPSSLAMTKSTDSMFTYDLFSLSPFHIDELANDLDYSPPPPPPPTTTTTTLKNAKKQ